MEGSGSVTDEEKNEGLKLAMPRRIRREGLKCNLEIKLDGLAISRVEERAGSQTLRISKCVSILTQAISRLYPHQVCSKEEVKAGFGYLVPLTLILTRILLTGNSTSRRAQLLVNKFGRGDVMKPQHHSHLKDQLRSRSPSRKETLMEFKRKEIFSLPAPCSSCLLSNLLPKPH